MTTLYKRTAQGGRLAAEAPGYRVAPWHFSFVFRGRRYQRSLETPDRAEALKRARRLQQQITDAVSRERFEDLEATKSRHAAASTVGELCAAYRKRARVKPRTIGSNITSLHQVIRLGTGRPSLTESEIAALPLGSILTRAALRGYQDAMLAGTEGEARGRAATTANSTVRQARSLTARAMVEDGVYSEEGVRLPDLAGWRSQKLLPEPRHVFVPIPTSLVDGIWAAAPALRKSDPQAYAALLLSICCGLRRGEAANLRWSQILEIDGRRLIRLGVSKSGHPRLIPLEPAVWDELRAVAPVVPMVQPADPGAPVPAGDDYILEGPATKRWREPFDRLSAWLAGLGWDRRKKAHELRKHFGSLLATQHGTRTAAMVLGNTEPVLRAHYDALLSLPETKAFRG